MKIVLDTNVLISGIFWQGVPSEILKAWSAGKMTLCISPEILDEYLEVSKALSKKYPSVEIEPVLDCIARYSKMYFGVVLPAPVSRDPDDDKFLACAMSAKSKVIISGDKDLLDIKTYSGIKIYSPSDFYKKYLVSS